MICLEHTMPIFNNRTITIFNKIIHTRIIYCFDILDISVLFNINVDLVTREYDDTEIVYNVKKFITYKGICRLFYGTEQICAIYFVKCAKTYITNLIQLDIFNYKNAINEAMHQINVIKSYSI